MKKYLLVLTAFLAMASGACHAAYEVAASSPSVAQRLLNAHNAMSEKRWWIATYELDKALSEDPRNADVHSLMGFYHRKRTTPDLALAFEHYNTALQIDPNHKGANEYIGETYLTVHKPAEAERHLAKLANICGNKTCEEYADLAKALATYKAANK